MSATIDALPPSVLPHNATAARTWSSGGGDYDRISRQIADAIEHCVDRLDPQPGERILDVATGTGWTARRVHARGALVTGVDFAPEVIRYARQHRGPGLDFDIGDAEELPFPDGHFDGVISTFGVMFCGNPERAAAELARVCKPDGRLALATWATAGGIQDMFQSVIKKHLPQQPPGASPPPSPFAWGDRARLTELLAGSFSIRIEEAVSYYREATAGDCWQAFATGYGPVKTLLGKLSTEDAARFQADFEAFHARHRTDAGILMPRPYVITVGRRRG